MQTSKGELTAWLAKGALGAGLTVGLLTGAAHAEVMQAPSCSFYVDSVNVGRFQYYDTREVVLDAELHVRLEDGDASDVTRPVAVAAVGARLGIRRLKAHGDGGAPYLTAVAASEDVTATAQQPGTYRLRYPFEVQRPGMSAFVELQDMAFFADIVRADGTLSRVWLLDGAVPFTLAALLHDKTGGFEVSVGTGSLFYPAANAAIYAPRRLCYQ